MKADELTVGEVLRNAKERYVVPLYQRKYQWHDERDGARVLGFWQDVAAKAGDILEGDRGFVHYMGALLMAPTAGQRPGAISGFHVVDGQQRLTTLLLLFAALREVAKHHGITGLAEDCDGYLFAEPGRSDEGNKLAKYKLTPTPYDRAIFFDIMDHGLDAVRSRHAALYSGWYGKVAKGTDFRALRAYEFFVTQIEDFVAMGPGDETVLELGEAPAPAENAPSAKDAAERLEALFQAIIGGLKLMVITLGEGDDAQVIFETLNSAGQPLLAMDLVRNNIFHRAEASFTGDAKAGDKAEALYEEIWKPFDAEWWGESAPNARPTRKRIDHFLANVLTAETGERIALRELYGEYRRWATPDRRQKFDRVEDELAVLQSYVPAYEILEGRRTGDLALTLLGDRLRVWQNTTVYPVAFQIAGKNVDAATRASIGRLIDSYITRRALCDLTPKNLNNVFLRMSNEINRDGVSVATARTFFSGLDGPAARFPDDDEVREGILTKPAYGRMPSRIIQHVLWQVELRMRSGKTEATARPDQLQVEHILPQSWQEHWPLPEAVEPSVETADDPRIRARQNAVHALGNLTIVTSSLNPAMRNEAFDKKRSALHEHSNLTMNKKIEGLDRWDETAIRDRGSALATHICEVWGPLGST